MTETIETTAPYLTEDETRTLAILADMVVPASADFGVPSAADPAIFAAILSDAARHHARLTAALSALEDTARQTHDAAFADLTAAQREGVVAAFREMQAADAQLVAALVTQCYYRDDRVVLSLGMELRPPHPLGYTAAEGDWSLLDPVRRRASFFRQAG
jgi:Gluconate 2-dehydrogenase subunit 3